MDDLEGCFNSLANAAVTGKDTLDTLTKSNATLTKTNSEMSATIKAQAEEIKSLTASLKNKKRGEGGGAGGGGAGSGGTKPKREAKWCPHCKRDTWHDPDDCFELGKNASKRKAGWKSVFATN